jgi:uncharacterized protein
MKVPRSRYRNTLLALVFCMMVLMALTRVLPFAGHAPFVLVLALIVVSNLYWWSWVDARLAPQSASATPPILSPRPRKSLRFLWNAYMIAMVAPLASSAIIHRAAWDALPAPAIMWLMIWHFCLVGIVGIAAVIAIPGSLVRWIRAVLQPQTSHAEGSLPARSEHSAEAPHAASAGTVAADCAGHPFQEGAFSRRRLLTRAALAGPLVITASALATHAREAGRFRVRRINVSLPRLPDRLRGLTITQISDIHVGRLFRPEHLPRMVDAANRLGSDLLVVTGDIIDHSNDYLPDACDALAAIEHRYGRFIIEGNHDLIDSPRDFVIYMKARERGFLIDQHVRVDIGGEAIQIAGLAWAGRGPRVMGPSGFAAHTAAALKGRERDLCTIALSHHPHAFDALADEGVDLALSGHTHGGQLMLTPQGFPTHIGAGSLLFRYIYGLYRLGPSQLYVNAGVGNWFPVRMNAPEEIVQIRLV